jgi:hypothetical protein
MKQEETTTICRNSLPISRDSMKRTILYQEYSTKLQNKQASRDSALVVPPIDKL